MRLESWEGRLGMRLESWEGRLGMRLDSWEGRPGMRLESWEGRVLTNEGNVPRPEGRDERRVEGKDWAMAAKPEGRRGQRRPGEGRPGMRLESWEGRVLTNDGNVPRPEGRDERRVEGKDWAMAAKPEGRPRPKERPGMRLES